MPLNKMAGVTRKENKTYQKKNDKHQTKMIIKANRLNNKQSENEKSNKKLRW